MTEIHLTPEDETALANLAVYSNEKLENTVAASSSRAFNLGCSVGLLPVAILVGITLIITRGNWVASIIISVLMLMGLVLFANLVALITRNNVLRRYYAEEISPEIDAKLQELHLPRAEFDRVAITVLLPGAALLTYIQINQVDGSGRGNNPWNKSIIRSIKQVLRRKT